MSTQTKQAVLTLALAFFGLMAAFIILGSIEAEYRTSRARAPDVASMAALLSTGGPDDFGYVYTDSLAPGGPTYGWLDASGGTPLTFADDDESQVAVTLPQAMTFYGKEYTQLYVTTNGYLAFDENDVVAQCVPAVPQPPQTLAAFCTDLHVGSGGVYTSTITYDGHQALVVQYDAVSHTVSGLTATFQIILDLVDDSVTYQYRDVPHTSAMTTTVGIVGYATDHDDALTYCHGATDCPPQDGLAVRFILPPRPELALTLTPSGAFPQVGDPVTYTVVMSNTGSVLALGAVMTNALPTGLSFLTGSLQAPTGSATYLNGTSTVHWEGDLALSAPVTMTYVASLDTNGFVYNTAVVDHPDALTPAGATSVPTDQWSEPVLLDAPHDFANYYMASRRHIAVGGSGTPHVAYGGQSLYYAVCTGPDAWGTTVVTDVTARYPTLLLDAATELPRIAFYDYESLWLARAVSTTGELDWAFDEIAYLGPSNIDNLELRQEGSGNLHLAYDSDDGIYYTTFDGSGWSAPVRAISDTDCYLDRGFSLDVDTAGTAHVACVYHQSSPSLQELRLYAAPWSSYRVVVSDTVSGLYYPGLAFDGDRPHLSFFKSTDLYHGTCNSECSATLVDDQGTYMIVSTVIEADYGTLAIAYTQNAFVNPTYTDEIRLATRPLSGGSWTSSTLDTFSNDEWFRPKPTVALDATGQARVAYLDAAAESLEYAHDATTEMVDESRTLGSATVALDDQRDSHVAYVSGELRHSVRAAESDIWTTTVVAPDLSGGNVAMDVDAADLPHLIHGLADAPLRHFTPQGATWIECEVDLPGNVDPLPSVVATVTDTVHLAYRAVVSGEMEARYAAFDGSTWTTETLASLGPDTWDNTARPRLVVQNGTLRVLYADCTSYTPSDNYPIALKLATHDGSGWIHETLHTFAGRCDVNLDYWLAGNDAGRLAAVAHIQSDAVRPSPQRWVRWIESGESGLQAISPLQTRLEVSSHQIMGGSHLLASDYNVCGDGLERIYIKGNDKYAEYTDSEGYSSQASSVGSAPGSSAYVVSHGGVSRSGNDGSAVEKSYEPYGLYVESVTEDEPEPFCCLRTYVSPQWAVDVGARSAPIYTSGECGTLVEVSTTPPPDPLWQFVEWTGAASGPDPVTMASMLEPGPDCSVATANYEIGDAGAVKSASTTTATVYPNTEIEYRVDMSWRGTETAEIILSDPYEWPRLDYKGSLAWGDYINCQESEFDHTVSCTGQFPKSEDPVSTFMSFAGETTCDLYTTQSTSGGSVHNTASTIIGAHSFTPTATTDIGVPFRLKASSPSFLPQAEFSPGHTVMLYTVPKGDEANCCTTCDLDLYLVVDNVITNPIPLKDDASGLTNHTDADFHADDCHHSVWFTPTENRAYKLDLYVVKWGDPFQPYYLADTLNLEPTTTPELAVYTDLRELFKEFNETQVNSASNDNDGNCFRDYYDALARMVRYAEDNGGILIDVRQDGYSADHDYYDGFPTRQQMGQEIDANITAQLKDFDSYLLNIAIIGDDAVVPFYRMPTPDGGPDEYKYFAGKADGNPTLRDTQNWSGGAEKGHFMSDLPYATYETTLPNYPKPIISIGRIYYQTPQQLVNAIDNYEQPINIQANATSATGLYLANEGRGLLWKDIFERAIVPVLRNHYGAGVQSDVAYTDPAAFQNGRAYLYSGATTPWNAITTTRRAVQNTNIILFYAHATHEKWEGEDLRRRKAGDTDPRVANARFIDHTDLIGANADIAISTGCHSGYNPTFKQNDAAHPLYRDNLVRALLDHQVAYYAPTVYGYGDNAITSHHDLLIHHFLKGLFTHYYESIGDAYYIALQRYQNTVATGGNSMDKYVIYSMHILGLPTQPLLHMAPSTLRIKAAPGPPDLSTTSTGTIDEDITVSEFEVSFDEEGHALFEVEGGGRIAESFGPVLPVVHRSYLLPQDATNVALTLTVSDSHTYTDTVVMQSSELVCFSFGPLTGTFTATGLYPNSLLTHTIFPDAGGQRLELTAIPLRYDLDTGAVTLYDRLAYRITYDSATTVSVTQLQVNNGEAVMTQRASVPVSLTLQVTSPLSGTLVWSIEDGADFTVAGGVTSLNVGAGASVLEWTFDTEAWSPGPKQLWVGVRDEDEMVVASGSKTFDVVREPYLIYLPLIMKQ
jgi:uncharacterized repeat protein (TIGR01451 family)